MEENFSIRLQKAMNIRNIKAIELSEKTGIPKSSLSEYIKGKYEAKQKGIYKLAKALDVSEGWLMGLDVPMERMPDDLRETIPLQELYKDTVPLLGVVKAGYDYLANENVLEYIPINFNKEDNNYYALKIKRRQHGNSNV
ncbi:MAG: helix-turn-helix domain-containing protein [Clostridia bacterium]|nr:helix-turn-helix domain-containing protein [Clostridia bacterium]